MISVKGEVLIFSDLHLGKGKDDQTHYDTSSKLIDCICNCGVKYVIFLGDWFDNRQTIPVKALDYSHKFLTKFKDSGIKFICIPGNHDVYYKNNEEVNSLQFFKEFDNVTLVQKPTDITINDSIGIIFPWCSDWNKYGETVGKFDFAMGHFEFVGARLAGTMSMTGMESNQMNKLAPLVFSGHYHLSETYEFKNCKVISVGNPFEMDWGDKYNKKSCIFFDGKNYRYQQNAYPKHISLSWSNLDYDNITGNFVRLFVDNEVYDHDSITKVIEKIKKYEPLELDETEYLYPSTVSKLFQANVTQIENYEKFLQLGTIDQIAVYLDEQSKQSDSVLVKMGLDLNRCRELSEQYLQLVKG
jgi:DNA repair exonuclease SbcCD nuclease subunit